MRNQEHNYELYREYRSIKVVPIDESRPIIEARIDEYGFWKIYQGHSDPENPDDILMTNSSSVTNIIPLFSIYDVLRAVVYNLYDTWSPPEKHSISEIEQKNISSLTEKEWGKICQKVVIRQWAKDVTRKSISKKFASFWKDILENDLDPLIVKLHKKLFSVSAGSGKNWNALRTLLKYKHNNEYLIEDLLKYSAARIAFLHNSQYKFENSVMLENGKWNWMGEFCPNRKIYPSLRRTLMNLPGAITYYLYFNLKDFVLPETTKDRLKLFSYLMLGENFYPNTDEKMKVILRSSEEKIREALKYMYEYFPHGHLKFDLRSTKLISSLLHTIYDYPDEIGEWDMLGLAKRSQRYHHENELERQIRQAKEDALNKKLSLSKTALPPIDLPENPNITFIDTYMDVVKEGNLMKHCIASYASRAVRGECYLFHVDYNGEMASVEVNLQGKVRQSYGPKDSINEASKYGSKELAEWGKNLMEKGGPKLRIITDEEYEKMKSIEVKVETEDYGEIFLEAVLEENMMNEVYEPIPF
jgi:hypothetical protein